MTVTLNSTGILYNDATLIENAVTATKGIFGYGVLTSGTFLSMTNMVNAYGGVSTDVTGVGQIKRLLAAASFGGDKAIFGYGVYVAANQNGTNLVSNLGVVAGSVTGVGTARLSLAAAGYGTDKAIFGYGNTNNLGGFTLVSATNLVSNIGVVATDTVGVGTARADLTCSTYGTDKAIFLYGRTATSTVSALSNLVSNTGVVAGDTSIVGTARYACAAAGYGGDKAIVGYGYAAGYKSMTNLISNTGVVATDTTGVGTTRQPACANYGGDKAIFGYGYNGSSNSMTNTVSNTGVVSSDITGVGTARHDLAACTFGS